MRRCPKCTALAHIAAVFALVAVSACDRQAPAEPGASEGLRLAKGGGCEAGETHCKGSCTDLQTDFYNCGACGNQCGPGETCQAGVCTAACSCASVGLIDCGTCTNTQFDPANCGICRNNCALAANTALTYCTGGHCAIGRCSTTYLDCNGIAGDGCEVDPTSDAGNCGACGVACLGGATCVNGVCMGGTELCDGVDNDGDGLIDEDWPLKGTPCDGPDSDFCAEGVYVCSADKTGLVCSDDTGDNGEVCGNGIDDDCDGEVDEGCSPPPGAPTR